MTHNPYRLGFETKFDNMKSPSRGPDGEAGALKYAPADLVLPRHEIPTLPTQRATTSKPCSSRSRPAG